VFTIPNPDKYLSASDVKDVAEEVIAPLPLPGVEGSPLDPGDIWLVVILACTNQTSIWETCKDTDGTPCDDDNDHGSHVAGTADAEDNSRDVIGVSTDATLHAVKVCTACGSCSRSDTATGLKWAADQDYDAANVSLGFSEKTQTLQDAVQYATDNGLFIAAAAGNDGP